MVRNVKETGFSVVTGRQITAGQWLRVRLVIKIQMNAFIVQYITQGVS